MESVAQLSDFDEIDRKISPQERPPERGSADASQWWRRACGGAASRSRRLKYVTLLIRAVSMGVTVFVQIRSILRRTARSRLDPGARGLECYS
jgi:hypothetical protein